MFRQKLITKRSLFVLSTLVLLQLSLDASSQSAEVKPLREDALHTRIMSLAQLYLEQKQLPQAENLLATKVVLDPDNAYAHYLLGKTFRLEKRNHLAWRELRKALALSNDPGLSQCINTALMTLPTNLQKPQVVGCLARQHKVAGQNESVLLFEGDWPGANSAADKVAANFNRQNIAVERVKLHDPDTHTLFDLFCVSSLPSVVIVEADSNGDTNAYGVKALKTTHKDSAKNLSSSLRDIPVQY